MCALCCSLDLTACSFGHIFRFHAMFVEEKTRGDRFEPTTIYNCRCVLCCVCVRGDVALWVWWV